jgi:Clostripain family
VWRLERKQTGHWQALAAQRRRSAKRRLPRLSTFTWNDIMPTTPQSPSDALMAAPQHLLTLVAYAPFGTDRTLSEYPDGNSRTIATHPFVENLKKVAALGVNVCALIDRVDDDSWLVTVPARGEVSIAPQFKCDMASPRALSHLLRVADQTFPNSTQVLAIEGHGAGYVPEIDRSKLTVESLTRGGQVQWTISGDGQVPTRSADGQPLLPMGEPMLPMGEPMLPANHYPISTWGIGRALEHYVKSRKSPRSNVAVLHFNNCFNMSVELLHCVAPYAAFATGYSNYNFFTAGRAYPAVFQAFQASATKTAEVLARLFAEANRDALAALPASHPTVGSTVALSRMGAIKAAIDALALALIEALPVHRSKIREAIAKAQQYDTTGEFSLDVPDETTDVGSLAAAFKATSFSPQVTHAASDLAQSVAGVFVYGVSAQPWVSDQHLWSLNNQALSMSIFLPDPALTGRWDWRSPFYLATEPGQNVAQPNVIDFLINSSWVEFIKKYHEQTVFKSLRAPRILECPVAVLRTTPKGHD